PPSGNDLLGRLAVQDAAHHVLRSELITPLDTHDVKASFCEQVCRRGAGQACPHDDDVELRGARGKPVSASHPAPPVAPASASEPFGLAPRPFVLWSARIRRVSAGTISYTSPVTA